MLSAQYTPKFERDVQSLKKKHFDIDLLGGVVNLVLEDTEQSRAILRQRHNMHSLKGVWSGSSECHVANAGDWLVIWKTGNGLAVFQRTGSHDELFR
ncbi:MAG: type II toxin-antitoxin system YafQ family toxin [Coriobacteriales bacterium]|nr:type II toxin-antitoxin system YafQ family toxin [Coriobacteriales bacterium]